MSSHNSLSLSLLDLMTCSFGGVVIVFLVLIAFFNNEETSEVQSSPDFNQANFLAPLLISIEVDTDTDNDEFRRGDKPSLWRVDLEELKWSKSSTFYSGISSQRVVICDPTGGKEAIMIDGLADDIAIRISMSRAAQSFNWSGLFYDWPSSSSLRGDGKGASLTVWPLPGQLQDLLK